MRQTLTNWQKEIYGVVMARNPNGWLQVVNVLSTVAVQGQAFEQLIFTPQPLTKLPDGVNHGIQFQAPRVIIGASA